MLAILVLVGVGYMLFPYLRTGQEPVPVQISTELEVESVSIQEESETHLVEVQYPQFGILAIDSDIREKVGAAVAEFQALPPNPPESAAAQHTFNGSFENVHVGTDVISFVLVLSQYTGGAHPLTLVSGLAYDRATSEQLLQEDAFQMIGMTVAEVSEAASAELAQKLGEGFFEEGANTNPENFSSFVVSADSVTFIFQQYQVAAYAAGVQEVSFPRVL